MSQPSHKAIEHQASLWVVKIDNNPLSPQEHAEFMHWVKAKPEHKIAFERLARWQISINQLPELSASNITQVTPTYASKPKTAISLKILSPVAAIFCLLVITFVITARHQNPITEPIIYQTEIGEQKTITLPDGSIVTLNTGSSLQAHYNNQTRAITLIQGEAFFEVFKDKKRPFEVTANNKMVRAVGTAFTVFAKKNSAIEVMVTEGRVELANTQQASSNTIAFLDQGQLAQLNAENNLQVSNVSADAIQQKLAWQHAMLQFNGEELAQVVTELSRYSSSTFIIASPALANKRIGGYFKANDVNAFLSTLTSQFNIDAHTDETGAIVLTER